MSLSAAGTNPQGIPRVGLFVTCLVDLMRPSVGFAAVKLIEEARIYKENLKATFVVNRKIANTAIGRDVGEALAAYSVPALDVGVTQRVVFAEAAAQGKSVHEIDKDGPAANEIEAVRVALEEFAK